MKPGIRRLMEDLRGARVLVVHPRDAEGDALIDQLKRIGCNVRGLWPPPAEIPRDVDTVFHLVEAAETPDFTASATDDGPTFVAIIDYENPTVLKRLLDSNAHGVVNKPIRPFGILSSLVLARSAHGYARRLQGKVQKLEETLKARRDVDKAVKIFSSPSRRLARRRPMNSSASRRRRSGCRWPRSQRRLSARRKFLAASV